MVCQKPEKRRFELQYLHRRTEDLYNHRFAHAKVCGGCGGGALERVAGTILQREKRTLKSPVQQQSDTAQVDEILQRTLKQTDRYRLMKKAGASEAEIKKAFDTPEEMSVFSWTGEKDTLMTPMDSIKYYKHFLRAGFMSMNPFNGHVKAYVGGPNYTYFQYDMAMVGRRRGFYDQAVSLRICHGKRFLTLRRNPSCGTDLTDENGIPRRRATVPRNVTASSSH